MKTKNFVIQLNSEPIKSRNKPNFKKRILNRFNIVLIDLHTVIVHYSSDEGLSTGFIVLHLDYENATATFKRPLIQVHAHRSGHYSNCFKILNNGFECIYGHKYSLRCREFSWYKISGLNDRNVKQKRIQRIEFPKQFFVTGVVKNNLYGFSMKNGDTKDFSKLVQVCLATKKQTTLKVRGWPSDSRYADHYCGDAIWIGRTLVVMLNNDRVEVSYFFAMCLDSDSLQWRKLDIQFAYAVDRLFSNYENTLIVKKVVFDKEVSQYYRFYFNRPETLTKLSLYSIKQDPAVLQDAVEYLPDQFKRPFIE